MKSCVFFDRDGIVNEPPPPEERYVLNVEKFRLIPGFLHALRVVADKGYAAILITNQKCVARGIVAQEELDAIHAHMQQLIRSAGLKLTDIYVCPHAEDDHPDRKPNPGMILRAAKDHAIDLSRSWMVGDNEKDIEAGQAAGCCKTVRVMPGDLATAADYHLQAMDELPALLDNELENIN
ncbi:MAG: HAD family hydrolase [Spartobacteria bacterium]|nr:HAD family hydrolase [Spartobacteria bacterium]